jgi:hypothetical protein
MVEPTNPTPHRAVDLDHHVGAPLVLMGGLASPHLEGPVLSLVRR